MHRVEEPMQVGLRQRVPVDDAQALLGGERVELGVERRRGAREVEARAGIAVVVDVHPPDLGAGGDRRQHLADQGARHCGCPRSPVEVVRAERDQPAVGLAPRAAHVERRQHAAVRTSDGRRGPPARLGVDDELVPGRLEPVGQPWPGVVGQRIADDHDPVTRSLRRGDLELLAARRVERHSGGGVDAGDRRGDDAATGERGGHRDRHRRSHRPPHPSNRTTPRRLSGPAIV